MYDLSNVLTAIASCSATFVAIIGGLIANKAISDSSEKGSIRNQLKQINAEIHSNDTRIDELSRWLEEDDAEEFIGDHLDNLLQLRQLEDIYDSSSKDEPTFEDLQPYWERAIAAKNYTNRQINRNLETVMKFLAVWRNNSTLFSITYSSNIGRKLSMEQLVLCCVLVHWIGSGAFTMQNSAQT